ncbi:CoA-transferase subunit beta, partial [Klebsiella pneumoniae]
PGVDVEQVREATGWQLRVSPELSTTEPPTEQELTVLRALKEAS